LFFNEAAHFLIDLLSGVLGLGWGGMALGIVQEGRLNGIV
jgi:hypothetical protein